MGETNMLKPIGTQFGAVLAKAKPQPQTPPPAPKKERAQ
jgi:hypothetical protein